MNLIKDIFQKKVKDKVKAEEITQPSKYLLP